MYLLTQRNAVFFKRRALVTAFTRDGLAIAPESYARQKFNKTFRKNSF